MLYDAPVGCPATGGLTGLGNPGSLTVNVTAIVCDICRSMLVEVTVTVPVYVPGANPVEFAETRTSPGAAALVEPLVVAVSHVRLQDVRHVIATVLALRTATDVLVVIPG